MNQVRCLELRQLMHELSNVTTGMLISSGLLSRLLAGDERCPKPDEIRNAGLCVGANSSPRGAGEPTAVVRLTAAWMG